METTVEPSPGELRLLGLCFVIIAAVWSVLFFCSIQAALPFNPIKLPWKTGLLFKVFLPQGWKYFTRDPREDRLQALSKDNRGHWTSALLGANASPSNGFGLRRRTRAQAIEMGMIAVQAKKEQWAQCQERLETCLERASVVPVKNDSPHSTLCGEIVLVRQPPMPWAWSRAKGEVTMPAKYARLDVSCAD